MPITISAKKALRQSIRRNKRNTIKKEQMKKSIKSIEKLLVSGKKEEAMNLVSKAYKAIDKAAKTGVIKKNAASRKKSRLVAKINKLIKS